MAEAIAERVRRYILDGSDEDLRRLLGVAETTREMARSAFRRVGMREGWHAIDCGCGPIGGLTVMAEMVGPAGRVVCVDFSESAIQRARSVVAALGLGNVELFAGDIHELGAAAVGGPFDLAYTRLFLMHQPDPVRTLSQIARLLRPSGWVVAQEALRSPPPRSHPHLDALGAYWDLVYDLVERAGGVPHGAVDGLAGSARAADLEVVAVDTGAARREASVAIAICRVCPVRPQCRDLSLRHWNVSQHGIWGGLLPTERAELHRLISPVRDAPCRRRRDFLPAHASLSAEPSGERS